jgi:putative membrane protein
MRTRTLLAAAGSLAVAFAAAPVGALHSQTPQDSASKRTWGTNGPILSRPQTRPDVAADTALIREAILGNQQEVTLGNLAAQKASNSAVKQFGQQMVTDHTTMGKQWSALAAQNGLPLKPAPDATQAQEVTRLQSLSGAAFDQAYMTSMIQDHQHDVTVFQSQGPSARSAEVRQLAASGLSTIQQHLTLATQVGSQVGAATNVAVTSPTPAPDTVQAANPPTQVTTQNGRVAPQRTGAASNNLKADRDFIQEVTADNLLEFRLADLAQRKATDPAVKRFASQMATDFGNRGKRWAGMAERNGLPSQASMGKMHQQKLDRVRNASGKNFDRVYMSTVIQHLQSIVPYFQNEGRSAQSNQVQRLVNDELPSLRQNLALAKRTGRQVNADTTGSARDLSKQ